MCPILNIPCLTAAGSVCPKAAMDNVSTVNTVYILLHIDMQILSITCMQSRKIGEGQSQ